MKRNKKLSSKGKRKTFCPIPNSLCHSLSLLPLPACAVVIFYQSTPKLEVVVSRLMHKKISQPTKNKQATSQPTRKNKTQKKPRRGVGVYRKKSEEHSNCRACLSMALLKPVEHFSTRSLLHNLYSMWPPHLHEQARLLLL